MFSTPNNFKLKSSFRSSTPYQVPSGRDRAGTGVVRKLESYECDRNVKFLNNPLTGVSVRLCPVSLDPVPCTVKREAGATRYVHPKQNHEKATSRNGSAEPV